MVFFAIWWAWVNYTWFASAYDTDDVSFRLTTFVVMAGVLVLATGVRRAAEQATSASLVVGYVIMRAALVPLWLRVAREHPERRTTAGATPLGVSLAQALWVLRPCCRARHGQMVPSSPGSCCWSWRCRTGPSAGPARRRGTATTSPSATRLFTIIVLGEVVLATSSAIATSPDRQASTCSWSVDPGRPAARLLAVVGLLQGAHGRLPRATDRLRLRLRPLPRLRVDRGGRACLAVLVEVVDGSAPRSHPGRRSSCWSPRSRVPGLLSIVHWPARSTRRWRRRRRRRDSPAMSPSCSSGCRPADGAAVRAQRAARRPGRRACGSRLPPAQPARRRLSA